MKPSWTNIVRVAAIDLQMLEWAKGGGGVRFALLMHHTDTDREWAYDRTSPIGRLDTALDVAQAEGWTVST